MQQQGWLPEGVKASLRDSSWVTVAWDWFQTFLGRAVEGVLWATMVFSCYQLIPGAAQPTPAVSSFVFILQFIALDIGGLGLNKVAQQQGLAKWSYARVIAYILIGITLITVAYAGIEHAVRIDVQVTAWVEVILVVARSVMTVLYGQAIHSLKHQSQQTRNRITELETHLSSVQSELSTLQSQVSSLRVQLAERQHIVDTLMGEVNTLTGQVQRGQREVSTWKQQATERQEEASTLQRRLHAILIEVDGVQAQLVVKDRELEALRQALDGEQQTVSRLREMLHDEQERVFSLSQRMDSGQAEQTSTKRVSSVPQEHGHSNSGQVIQLDSSRARRKSEQEKTEHAVVERIRDILKEHPGLSARAITKQIPCSPTTAAKWQDVIEQEQQNGTSSTECINE